MPSVNVYNCAREKVGEVELDPVVFGAPVKEHLFHLVVRYQLAARRQGTHKTRGRSEVRGGGKKPYRQKGTGRARHGTIRSPIFRGGGVVFGPVPRSHAIKVPRKVRRAALRAALTRRLEEGALTVVDRFDLQEIKTRAMREILERFELDDVLIVLDAPDEVVSRSARNLPGVLVLPVEGLNVYDVLRHRALVFTRPAIDAVTARLGS